MNEQQQPMAPVTIGTSILGVTFKDGVIIAGDTLISYGSLARFRSCSRVMTVNNDVILGASGDYADYQYMQRMINQKIIHDDILDDGFRMKPRSLHCWLTRVLYNRRSNFDPLWNTYLVGGLQDGKPFLGYVDKIGTAFEDAVCATGYGAYIALPLMREATENKPPLTQEEARALIVKCMRILYYRDARSFNKYEMAVVTPGGTEVVGPLELDTNWDVHSYVRGYE